MLKFIWDVLATLAGCLLGIVILWGLWVSGILLIVL